MDLSILRLQDSPSIARAGERRRSIRHKPRTPAYAVFGQSSGGMAVNLNEILDMHEEGFAVQTDSPLPVNQNVSFSLDLPETRALLRCSGQVVWSDREGRAGIRFSGLPDPSRRLLKEWLFINLLIACSQQASKRRSESARESKIAEAPVPPLVPSLLPSPVPDFTGMLAAIEAVRREVKGIVGDSDAAFRLITDRALSLTGASGAALAFLTNDAMLCRARAGDPAPPIGASVDAKRGLSGECVRSGHMIKCNDTENDPRVDRELCRTLGIGSVLAAPIVADFRVVGLIEVFSPRPHAFTDVHETALDRLVEIIPKAKPASESQDILVSKFASPAAMTGTSKQTVAEPTWEPESEVQEPLRGLSIRPFHLVLLILAACTVFLVLGYLLAPTIEKWWLRKSGAGANPTAVSAATVLDTGLGGTPLTVDEVRRIAEQGDANAQWTMAVRYHNGDGVLQDDSQAVRWFERAAEQGHVASQGSLGAYYWAGRGVPEDLSKAYFWSLLAMAQGDESSKSRVEGLAARMSRPQIIAARQQAEEWLRQHRSSAVK